jgi:hypothetical protein
MDQKKYDELDKLFQSRLKNDKLIQEEWNTPPKTVFDGAMTELDKKKKYRKVIFWIIALLILTGFIGFTINNLNRINQLENTIANYKSSEKLNVATPENNEKELFNNTQIDNKQITGAIEKNKTSAKITGDSKDAKFQFIPIIQNNTGQEYIQNDRRSDLAGISSNLENKDAANRAIINRHMNNTGSLASVNNGISKAASVISVPMRILSIERNVEQNKSSILTYIMSGLNATTIRMTNTEGASFSLTEYERYYADIYAGAGVEYQLNPRWAIDFNASYNRMHVKSVFEDEIIYDKSKEMIDNQGMSYYDDDYDIYSVMGRFTGNLNFDLEQSTPNDQDNLLNRTTIDNSFSTLGLSLGSLYSPFQNDRLRISVGAGLSYHHLINIREEMEATITHESGLMVQESISIDAIEKANRNYWSIYGNVRFSYAVNADFGIKLDLSSAHSINSIRKTTMDAEPHTFINNLRSGLLFYYKF